MQNDPDQPDPDLERALDLLGPLEARIMSAVWSGELPKPFVVRSVQPLAPDLAYTTLMTTLNRLADKGLLTVEHERGQRVSGRGQAPRLLGPRQPRAGSADARAIRGCSVDRFRGRAR